MEFSHERLDSLSSVKQTQKHCFWTYIKLIFLPFAVYLYFLLGYLQIISLPVHIHSIILMGAIFLVSLVFARHNATFARCYFKKNVVSFNGKLKEYIVKNLMTIDKYKKSNASFDAFIKNYSSHIRNGNYASVGASIFPTMGILGTFISIALTMPDFAAKNSQALELEISALLSGVGTAFYVSIYGILLSLWWIFFEKLGLSKFDKDMANIKEDTKVFFWTKEEIQQSYLQENLSHFKEISTVLSTLSNDKFFERLGRSIEDKFSLFENMIKLENDMIKTSSKQLKENLKEINEAQEKQQHLGKIHSNILKTLQNFSVGLDDMQVKLIENFHVANDAQVGIDRSIEKLNRDLSENILTLNTLFSSLPKVLNDTQKVILSEFGKSLNKSINRFWDESLLSSYERIKNLEDVNIDELKSSVDEIDSQSGEFMKTMEDIKQDNDKK